MKSKRQVSWPEHPPNDDLIGRTGQEIRKISLEKTISDVQCAVLVAKMTESCHAVTNCFQVSANPEFKNHA